MRNAFVTLLTLAVVGGAGAAFVIWSGFIDVGANRPGGLPDQVLQYASTRSLRYHAWEGENPRANDPNAMKAGLEAYRSLCIDCHGGPGVPPETFAAGLNPSAPDLASPSFQGFSDGMLAKVVSDGIQSTGMPAFDKALSRDQIWGLVAFVRHLPALRAEERSALGGKEKAPVPSAAASPDGGTPPAAEHDHAAAAYPGPQVHKVAIKGFKFEPANLEVFAGDSVEWTNQDFAQHTATSDDKKTFDTGTLAEGKGKRVVLGQAGSFPYFCRFHIAMRGTVTVKPLPSPPANPRSGSGSTP